VLYAHPLRIAQGICLAGIALSAMPCMLKISTACKAVLNFCTTR